MGVPQERCPDWLEDLVVQDGDNFLPEGWTNCASRQNGVKTGLVGNMVAEDGA